MCRKQKCQCSQSKRSVVEKPKKRKREPIDKVFLMFERQMRDPPRVFSNVIGVFR